MGIKASITADPTALLDRKQYLSLCNIENEESNIISKMILRRQSKSTNELITAICKSFITEKVIDIEQYSISEWLNAISNSKIVITNSFHCVMMCLKLHTPFFVVLEDGVQSGMNDRFKTLLDIFNLNDRIINSMEDIEKPIEKMDFERIDLLMDNYAETLKKFLDDNIL